MRHAVSLCIEFGSELPLPRSKEENSDFNKVVQSFGKVNAALDGNDIDQEGVWRSSNGDLLTYFNWKSSAPDNNYGIQHYIYGWKDVEPHYIGHIICQKEVNGKLRVCFRVSKKL